jgi:hypothetical protein
LTVRRNTAQNFADVDSRSERGIGAVQKVGVIIQILLLSRNQATPAVRILTGLWPESDSTCGACAAQATRVKAFK